MILIALLCVMLFFDFTIYTINRYKSIVFFGGVKTRRDIPEGGR